MLIGSKANFPVSRSPREAGQDDVPSEFPGRHQSPGPDDVYCPDTNTSRNSGTYGPYYYDTGSGSDSGGGLVLF